jgi:glutaredoxin
VRCKPHDLACANDGLCVVCRREGRTSKRPGVVAKSMSARVWVGLAVVVATMGAAGAYRVRTLHPAPLAIGPDARAQVPLAPPAARVDTAQRAATTEGQLATSRVAEALAMYQASASASANAPPPPARSTAAPPEAKVPAPDRDPPGALSNVNVVVYTTGWCSVCRRAKAWMGDHGIAYDERDVESSSEYASAMHAINPRGSVPTFDVEGEVMVGFSEQGLVAAMTRAARRGATRSR